jgi:hypothetical protein
MSMSPWACLLCDERVDVEDIVSGDHMRLFHPDDDPAPDYWQDGELEEFCQAEVTVA